MKFKILEEFETMRDTAELKALSNLSLNCPLSDEQFIKAMDLKNKLFEQ